MTHSSPSKIHFLTFLILSSVSYASENEEIEMIDVEPRDHLFQDAFAEAFKEEIHSLSAEWGSPSATPAPAPVKRWSALTSYLSQNPIYQKFSTGLHWFKEWFHWQKKMTPNAHAIHAQELLSQYTEWEGFAKKLADLYSSREPLSAKTLQLCEAYWTAHADHLPRPVQEAIGKHQPIWLWPFGETPTTLLSLGSDNTEAATLEFLGITDILRLPEDSSIRHQVLQAKDLYQNLIAAATNEERLSLFKATDETFDGGLGRMLVIVDNWKLFIEDHKILVEESKGHADELVIRIAEHMIALPESPEMNQLRAQWLAEALMTGLIEGRVRAFTHIWSLMPESLQHECAQLSVIDFAHPALVSSYEITNRIQPNLAQKLKKTYERLGPSARKASPFFLSLWRSLSDIAYQAALKRAGVA